MTSFEYLLHPVGPVIYGGAAFYRADQADDVLRFYRDWTRELPDELTTMVAFLTVPPEPFMPPELIGQPMIAVACCHLGSTADGEAAIAPLRAIGAPAVDLLGPIPYTVLQRMFDGSAPRGLHAYWKTQYLHDLTNPAIDSLITTFNEVAGLSPFTAIHLHHLEGAVRQQPVGGSAFPHRDNRFVLNLVGGWLTNQPAKSHANWVRTGWETIRQHTTGTPYLNFLADQGTDRVRAAYDEQTFNRLTALKNTHDPTNLFRHNQNIPPTPEPTGA